MSLDTTRRDILRGMSLCLSGFQNKNQKAELHKLITELGGSYTTDLLTVTTTHLIVAENPATETEKYREAIQTNRIKIVHYKWLEMCSSLNRIVPIHEYTPKLLRSSQGVCIPDTKEIDLKLEPDNPETNSKSSDLRTIYEPTCPVYRMEHLNLQQLHSECLRLSQVDGNDSIPCPLFLSCNFYFAGFQEGTVALKKLSTDTTTTVSHVDFTSSKTNNSFLYDLQQLVRSYMGTIYWTLADNNITHVIVHPDYCRHPELRYDFFLSFQYIDSKRHLLHSKDLTFMFIRIAILNYCKSSPICPVAVTPHWIVESVEKKTLVNSQIFSLESWANRNKVTSPQKRKIASPRKKIQKSTTLFEGAVFFIVHSPAPDETVKFDEIEIQHIMQSNGGILLTKDIVNLRRKELKSNKDSTLAPRICYIIHVSGSFLYEHAIKSNPILSHIKNHNLFQLIPVNPIWIQTCLIERAEVQVNVMPYLFQPQTWALRLIPEAIRMKASNNGKGVGIAVSVSGFPNIERSGIRHALTVIGAKYTENLPITNTHLICHPNAIKGPKATKAKEWNLHIVTIDWLYHILKFGFKGENSEENGCEHRFSCTDSMSPPMATLENESPKTNMIPIETNRPQEITIESNVESEEYDTSPPPDSTQQSSYRKNTVFADIACPAEQITIGINQVRSKRRRKIVLDTQCAKDDATNTTASQAPNYYENGSEVTLVTGKNSRMQIEEGDESQKIWWGNV